jgi:hypothetical protein
MTRRKPRKPTPQEQAAADEYQRRRRIEDVNKALDMVLRDLPVLTGLPVYVKGPSPESWEASEPDRWWGDDDHWPDDDDEYPHW